MDRALVNSKCSKIFLDSFAIFERSGIYDHAKYVIQIKTVEIPEAETFLVFNYLIKHPQLHESITSYYTETESLFHARSEIHRFHKKLKGLKTLLRAMNRERYGDITRRTQVSLDVVLNLSNNFKEYITFSIFSMTTEGHKTFTQPKAEYILYTQ